jgi:hypothetical protein
MELKSGMVVIKPRVLRIRVSKELKDSIPAGCSITFGGIRISSTKSN